MRLPSNIFYSPLAGCSDYPYRKMSSRYCPGLQFCEMVKMEALLRCDSQTFHLLDFDRDMHPMGAQIVGGNVKLAGASAKIIEDLGFDVVDLNCGCPVDKVTRDGSGSGLLKTPSKVGDMISEMVASVRIPVTVKIRMGWDLESINAKDLTRIAESAGASVIFIHGRTRAQAYRGPATWDIIGECKAVAKEIKVFGNGDIFDPEASESIFNRTLCDGVLVSRGTMGAPWIVDHMYKYLLGEGFSELTNGDVIQVLRDHISYVVDYQQDKKAISDIRKVGCWYLKKLQGRREFRAKMSKLDSLDDLDQLLDCFTENTLN